MSSLQLRISAIYRIEAPRLLGALLRMLNDLSLAEDIAQDTLLAAIEHWTHHGIPESPGAWLMLSAKNKAIDAMRHRRMVVVKNEELLAEEGIARGGWDGSTRLHQSAVDNQRFGDDVLRLMLVACHPVLSREARVALTLKLLGGLSTQEVARAFLQSEATIAQRIVRAKRSLAEAQVPFDVPEGAELRSRVPSLLEVLYLIFNEGYAATAGDDWMRPELCRHAMRLGRVLMALVPDEPEISGLVALMELQASRMRARTDETGRAILLDRQERHRWDHTLIRHGLKTLARALEQQHPLGPYTLQAAIAACHARARSFEETDWLRIVALYDALVEVTQSPIVELNRAVAVSRAFGPAQALQQVETLEREGALHGYAHLYSVRGDLLEQLERYAEARQAFEKALALLQNESERAVVRERLAGMARPS